MSENRDLAQRVGDCWQQALASGALIPLVTRVATIHDGGIEFVVRVAERWAEKPQSATSDSTGEADSSPFLPPYEPDLHVGDISATHVALLNKFPVIDNHLLMVTRSFEEQTTALTADDFAALLHGLAAIDGLAFYNGGAVAGASQRHRHLQVVPLPLGPQPPALPVQPWLEGAVLNGDGIGRNAGLPFEHCVARLPARWLQEPQGSGAEALAVYQAMWRYLDRDPSGYWQPQPFNLLATRDWLWLVPRRREGLQGLSVNALGFAGAFLAGDAERLERLRETGPLHLLASV